MGESVSVIDNEKALGKALKEKQEFIEIKGDLRRQVLKIKATGKIAWAIAIGGIGIAVTLILVSGGTATPASALVGVGSVSVLGLPATISAVSIAVAAGGVGTLNSLRKYKISSDSGDKLILNRT